MTMAEGASAIALHGIQKSYPFGFLHRQRRLVLGPLDLQVQRGEIFGYLGANGSGKTTTLKVLMGLVTADTGAVTVLGCAHEDPEWRRRTGFLPEHPYFYDYLTGREFLDYAGRLCGLPAGTRADRARRLLERVGLRRSADIPLRRYSKGMLQRLGLAQALVGEPELLVLDEPMSGLDPLGRVMVRDLILEQRDQGRTVLFSTHILSDAESLCDRVGLIKAGRLVGCGRLDEILRVDVAHMEVVVGGVGEPVIAQAPGVSRFHALGERWRLEVEEARLVPALERLTAAGGRVLSVQPVRQTLEELFVREAGPAEGERWTEED